MNDPQQQALIARYRPRIEKELAELEALRQQSEADRAPVALDQQSVGRLSRMDAMQGQAMAGAAERWRTGQLARLRRALVRMEEGDFGCCAECGEEIAAGRLDADPSHHLCVRCAAQQE